VLTVYAREAGRPAEQIVPEISVYRSPLLPGFELRLAELLAAADWWSGAPIMAIGAITSDATIRLGDCVVIRGVAIPSTDEKAPSHGRPVPANEPFADDATLAPRRELMLIISAEDVTLTP
jgi:hypothetical protein